MNEHLFRYSIYDVYMEVSAGEKIVDGKGGAT